MNILELRFQKYLEVHSMNLLDNASSQKMVKINVTRKYVCRIEKVQIKRKMVFHLAASKFS
jgi:hypothetical protein